MRGKASRKKLYIKIGIFITILSLIASFWLANYIDISYKDGFGNILDLSNEIYNPANMIKNFIISEKVRTLFWVMNGISIPLIFYLMFFASRKVKYAYHVPLIKVTEDISIPPPSGRFQHGSSWFTPESEFEKIYNYVDLDGTKTSKNHLYVGLFEMSNKRIEEDKVIEGGGLVLGIKEIKTGFFKKKIIHRIYFDGDDTHNIVIGATRSGKTRGLVLQTIGLLGLAGENIVASDPKGELFCYTSEFLKKLNYEVITLDFSNPEKSNKYNFAEPIIRELKRNNIDKAIELTSDMTNQLVGKQTGEPIWHDGQSSVIAFSILAVLMGEMDSSNGKMENMQKYEYQNFTNVYHFVAEMCKTDNKGKLYIERYFERLPEDHPAKVEAKISEIAPSKTRGSFFTSALTTLRLFALKNIYSMTNETDFDIDDFDKKRAIFVILPDEKTTYYKIASLFINSYYTSAVNFAKRNGNRLNRRLNFVLDEFGNFSVIPDFTAKISVGGGYGIRFGLMLQSFKQLDAVYDEKDAVTIQDNCNTLVYLKSNVSETRQKISDSLGKYTVTAVSDSTSIAGGTKDVMGGGGSYSSSTSLMERALLTAEEIGRIERPYSLVITSSNKSIMYAPDLVKYDFNELYGLGSREHNQLILIERQEMRRRRNINNEIQLWGIWREIQELETEKNEDLGDEITNAGIKEKPRINIFKDILDEEFDDEETENFNFESNQTIDFIK